MSATLAALNGGSHLRELLPNQDDIPPADVDLPADVSPVSQDPLTGAITIADGDGGVVINFNPRPAPRESKKFGDNLAELIDPMELGRIGSDLIQGIRQDDASRSEWLETRARGLELLGTKLEPPRAGASSDSAPMEGMSTVRHPLLLEACLRFQANARSEMLPSDGPVKVKNWDDTGATDMMAEALEKDMNKYLLTTASEYYPDTDQMLFMVGFGGSGYKKVYSCPIRRRPVSESIDAKDVIVSEGATDLRNAPRVTHQIKMRTSMLRRMQIAGVYRDLPLMQPSESADRVAEVQAEIEGVTALPTRPEDQDHTIYECYCELDIRGFEHKKGLPLPYKVTMDRDSEQVLEIRRNWDEADEMCLPKMPLVRWPYVPYGLYCLGLVHILGNLTNVLTASFREMLDAGMYANFPGGLVSEAGGRQKTNNIRVPPGGMAQIQTGGAPLRDVVMPLPYKDITPGLMQLTQHAEEMGQRLGGTSELQVGEGRADVPVGTILATIEQATKVGDSVHKRLHAAQAEEFQLLKEEFRQDPEAFWRFNKRPAAAWNESMLLAALDNCDLVPMADPNTPSHTHRLMKAMALAQGVMQAPQYWNVPKVLNRVYTMAGFDDISDLLAPPGAAAAQPPNPAVVAAQTKLQIAQMDNARAYQDSQTKVQLTQQQAAADQQQDQAKAAIEAAKLQVAQQQIAVDAQKSAQQHQMDVADTAAGHLTALHRTAVDSTHRHLDRAAEFAQQGADHQLQRGLATLAAKKPAAKSGGGS